MPRPRLGLGYALAAILATAILGPAAVQTALAAAAGTLFEAAPFVLAAEFVPQRFAALVPLAGCGCRGRLPGALSLPATALCWIAFGPAIALARLVAALAVAVGSATFAGSATHQEHVDDGFATLLRLAPSAAVASLVASALPDLGASLGHGLGGHIASLAFGAAFGCLAPCATVGVAVAAAVSHRCGWIATGILLTTGLAAIPRSSRSPGPGVPSFATARIASLGLALALAAIVHGGPQGLVNPRLLPFLALGSILAVCAAIRPTRARPSAYVVPIVMLAALVAGSPVPAYTANATDLEGAFSGERLTFDGVAHTRGGGTVLERFAISCCRADAAPIAIRLAKTSAVHDGSWVEASGTLVQAGSELVLRADSQRRIEPPNDPFLYR